MRSKRGLLIGGLATVVLLIMLTFLQAMKPMPTGPLQVSGPVNAFGLPVTADRPFSMVVFHRSERPATATLRGVSLVDPDPGLTVVGTGLAVEELLDPYYPDFPPRASLVPVGGHTVRVQPDSGGSELTFVIGLELASAVEEAAAHGVWLDYDVDGRSYRALVPWLVRFCRLPVAQPCQAPTITDFTLPPVR